MSSVSNDSDLSDDWSVISTSAVNTNEESECSGEAEKVDGKFEKNIEKSENCMQINNAESADRSTDLSQDMLTFSSREADATHQQTESETSSDVDVIDETELEDHGHFFICDSNCLDVVCPSVVFLENDASAENRCEILKENTSSQNYEKSLGTNTTKSAKTSDHDKNFQSENMCKEADSSNAAPVNEFMCSYPESLAKEVNSDSEKKELDHNRPESFNQESKNNDAIEVNECACPHTKFANEKANNNTIVEANKTECPSSNDLCKKTVSSSLAEGKELHHQEYCNSDKNLLAESENFKTVPSFQDQLNKIFYLDSSQISSSKSSVIQRNRKNSDRHSQEILRTKKKRLKSNNFQARYERKNVIMKICDEFPGLFEILVLSLLFLTCALCLWAKYVLIPYLNAKANSIKIQALEQIQGEILTCLTEQQINVDDLKYLDFQEVCLSESFEWKDKIKEIATTHDILSLLSAIKNNSIAYDKNEEILYLSPENRLSVKGLNLYFIIHQLEHLKLLPSEKEIDIDDEKKHSTKIEEEKISEFYSGDKHIVKNDEKEILYSIQSQIKDLKTENTELRKTLQNLLSRVEDKIEHKNVAKASISAKDSSHDCDSNPKELKEIINNLLFENDELKRKVAHLRYVPTFIPSDESTAESHIYLSKSGSIKHEHKINSDKENANKMHNKYVQQNIDNNKESELNLALLYEQIEKLQNSISPGLAEIEKLNEMMSEFSKKLKVNPIANENEWSWEYIKNKIHETLVFDNISPSKSFENMIDKINSLTDLNVSDIFGYYIGDKKKSVESVFNVFSFYLKQAHEMVKEQVSKVDTEVAKENMWNVLEKVQEKWSHVKAEAYEAIKEMCLKKSEEEKSFCKKYFTQTDDYKSKGDKSQNINIDNNFSKHEKRDRKANVKHGFKEGKQQNDWLFKRAESRAKLRQAEKNSQMNWFLRRKMYRAAGRNWQNEQLDENNFE